MHPVAKKYFDLTLDDQKLVQVELCIKVYRLWLDYVSENGICEYQESVAGTIQTIDYSLPKDAIEAVKNGIDTLNVAERNQEPAAALQDNDLAFTDDMEMAYYSIYNLYQYHIAHKLDVSWVIVNQALSAYGKKDTVAIFGQAIENVA
ncbi:hypothetical protein OA92_02800 [Marinomonas sp. SBI22]|uniref:hypothetical protein n=1 Tax=unclassified Marinomonas TaxID=196814 RepID=UPI0007AF8FB1|nr:MULTISPECIES: hypothetical protein [unclassified Marinomonas]KZM38923.1 hypothetical protein OA91_23360 [Marinomonas sp. SBI8L]KZM44821.1 hypothetical protein OA92_02800 [Marinomonas sp. SBI22]